MSISAPGNRRRPGQCRSPPLPVHGAGARAAAAPGRASGFSGGGSPGFKVLVAAGHCRKSRAMSNPRRWAPLDSPERRGLRGWPNARALPSLLTGRRTSAAGCNPESFEHVHRRGSAGHRKRHWEEVGGRSRARSCFACAHWWRRAQPPPGKRSFTGLPGSYLVRVGAAWGFRSVRQRRPDDSISAMLPPRPYGPTIINT